MPAPYTPFPQQVLVTPGAPGNAADGSGTPLLGGKQGEAIFSRLHGSYFTQNYRGNLFCADGGQAGLLIPIYSGTALTFCLWNPASSGKLVVPVRLTVGWHDTTGAPGDIYYCYTPAAGDGIATGGACSAFTAISGMPQSCNLGSGATSKTKVGSAATLAAAPTLHRTSGMSQLTTTGATTTSPLFNMFEDFEGTIIIPPGVIFGIVGTAALLSKFNLSMVWEEVPL